MVKRAPAAIATTFAATSALLLPAIARACPACQLDVNGSSWWIIGVFMTTPWFVVIAIALTVRWLRKLEREEEYAVPSREDAVPSREKAQLPAPSVGPRRLARNHLR